LTCRAGKTTKYAFGDSITREQAHFSESEDSVLGWAQRTVEVGSLSANDWGLYDVHGNVWEWCEDNWHNNYQGAPQDGSVWSGGDASLRVLRGGSWRNYPHNVRSANRLWLRAMVRGDDIGFRLSRML
jgi:formylglycine-generating enzyme required for sulfatase activity